MKNVIMWCALCMAVAAYGQEFTSGTARLAKKGYEEAVAKAKKEYTERLQAALTQAKLAKDKAEEDRINETLQGLTDVTPPQAREQSNTVTIAANKDTGMDLGQVKKGTKVTISYVSGLWGSGGHPIASPDESPGIRCQIQAKIGTGYAPVVDVPMGTKRKPFMYRFMNDFDSVRISATCAPEGQGEVLYRIDVKRVP
jgi:hypothetical protein